MGNTENWENKLIESQLLSMNSFQAIQYVLNDIELHDIQCIDIMKMLYMKRCMLLYDTGLGKTLLTAAFIKLLCNEDPTRKFIMFVKKDQLIQTPKKLHDACGKSVLASSAEAKSLNELINVDRIDTATILMLTHTCLQNETIMSELFQYKDKFCGLIIDEAHELNNFNRTNSGGMLEAICNSFEYCIALTATPITTNALQLAKLAHMVDSKRYPDYNKLKRKLLNGDFDITLDPLFFISRDGSDFDSVRDYHGIIEWVPAMPLQTRFCGGAELMQLCKGEGATNQVNALVKLIKERKDKRGLVYINQHAIRSWVLPFLDSAGIKYDCINGHTKQADRERIMDEFNIQKSLDVVVTSVTTAIDLDCDYVIFYEFTPLLKQMIGRAHRGLGDKHLDIIFMLTEDSCEVDYFVDNIVSKSLLAQTILHKSYSEVEDAYNRIQEHENGIAEKVYV